MYERETVGELPSIQTDNEDEGMIGRRKELLFSVLGCAAYPIINTATWL